MNQYIKNLNEYFRHTKFIEGNEYKIINKIKNDMYQHYIKVHYDIRNGEIIFIFSHIGNNFMKKLIRRECNGYIIRCYERNIGSINFYTIFRPVYSVTPVFNGNYISKELTNNPENYTIQKLYDGTTFGFYYLDGWNVCSKNAISIGESYTYMGYNLRDIINEYVDCSELNTKMTYSFLIIDNRLHPYQTIDNNAVYILEAREGKNAVLITDYNYPEELDVDFQQMVKNNAPDNCMSGHMGYIIRSNNRFINIAYKSALFTCVEKMLYNFSDMEIKTWENNWDDVIYYNYMRKNTLLPKLIPHIKDKYDMMDEQLYSMTIYVKNDLNMDLYPIQKIKDMLEKDVNINQTDKSLLKNILRSDQFHNVLKEHIV